jgi:death on curing protein
MRYLNYSELIFINGKLLNDDGIIAGKQKVRDIDLLLAAEARPRASAFGQDAYSTLPEKAAALLHSIARNHPFKDGNKRTATVAALFMLEVNGHRARWNPEEALVVILAIAEGQQTMEYFAEWLQLEDYPGSPEPDLERDTAHIERLIFEHRWLLNELAGR